MSRYELGEFDAVGLHRRPPKPKGKASRTTNLGAYYRCRVSGGDPLLADYEYRASDPHCCGCSVARGLEIPLQVAISLSC